MRSPHLINNNAFCETHSKSTLIHIIVSIFHQVPTVPLSVKLINPFRWGVLQVVHPRENDFVPKSQSIYYSTSTPNEFSVVIKENVRTTNSSHFQVL